MSDNPKEAEKEMDKAIFIAADCWLEVFDLLPRSQLGFGIALISHRFDYYVDEHFKTRKWTLRKLEIQGKTRRWPMGSLEIRGKIGEHGAKEMKIVNSDGKELPMPQNPLPKKFIGFGSIEIVYIDQDVLTFLGHFHRLFSVCSTKLYISTGYIRISEFVVLTILPMFKDTIRLLYLSINDLRHMRQFAPSFLFNCPSLQIVNILDDFFPEFPPDDSAKASDGQALTKWLFTPHPDKLPKLFFVHILEDTGKQWSTIVEQIKAEFSVASSAVSFNITVAFMPSSSFSSVVPFEMTNELTGEKLKMTKSTGTEDNEDIFEIIRCSIAEGSEEKLEKALTELVYGRKNNKIDFSIQYRGVDEGLLDAASPGPSGDQKQQKN